MHFVVVFNLTRFARDKYDHFALRSHLQSPPHFPAFRDGTDERHSGQLEELDVESILAFAERVLPRAADLGAALTRPAPAVPTAVLSQRNRGKGYVGTRVTAPAFSYLRTIEDGNERLVAQICPRWNRLQHWFELAEAFRSAA